MCSDIIDKQATPRPFIVAPTDCIWFANYIGRFKPEIISLKAALATMHVKIENKNVHVQSKIILILTVFFIQLYIIVPRKKS